MEGPSLVLRGGPGIMLGCLPMCSGSKNIYEIKREEMILIKTSIVIVAILHLALSIGIDSYHIFLCHWPLLLKCCPHALHVSLPEWHKYRAYLN